MKKFNRNISQPVGLRVALGGALALGAFSTFGCATEPTFARIDGVTVTQAEYIHALERQNVALPNGQAINAERLVIDQLIGKQVILSEAAKANAVPSDKEVESYYNLQKSLFENQAPGKSYEASMKEQGTSPEEVKADMKFQLAEANLYAQKLKIGDKEVREAYQRAGNVGLPARVQLRLILVAPNSADFKQAQELIKSTPFDEVAKQINPPALRATGGLIAQPQPVSSLGQKYQAMVQQRKDGEFFGPVDFALPNQPKAVAWVKIEHKIPAYNINPDDAVPLIKRQLVTLKLAEPANQNARNEIVAKKLAAKFEPTDKTYSVVWDALRKNAEEAGAGKTAPVAPLTGGALTAPPAGTAPESAPVAAPKTP
ncbi:MAG: SurA N-terminal domain-containing protein [Capsulimonadales bacterium]|nr:SurA N-terminal domain-containing protein [Capsulimonadales bacterium]